MYERLPVDGHRYEVINGRLTAIPTPPTCHQEISGQLLFALGPWADDRGWELVPYVGLVLSEEAPRQQYLIPDIVCPEVDDVVNRLLQGAPLSRQLILLVFAKWFGPETPCSIKDAAEIVQRIRDSLPPDPFGTVP